MKSLRIITEMARADLLERIRRYSFLFMLLGAAWLAYTVFADYWRFRIAENYRIALGPVRTGTLVALITNLILSFAGFYLVKGTITRDRRTGVGQILNATPLNRLEYVAGKFASNLTVLLSMVMILVLASLIITWIQLGTLDLPAVWHLLSPFLLLTVPVLFTIAGLALLFDSLPYLDGALGNVLYLFLWVGLFSISETYPSLDIGLNTAIQHVQEALASAHPDANIGSYALQVRTAEQNALTGFQWEGLPWNAKTVLPRLNFLGIGFLLSGISAAALYIFDPFSREQKVSVNEKINSSTANEAASGVLSETSISLSEVSPVIPAGFARSFLRSITIELRLLLRGHRWWWYISVLGANIFAFAIDHVSLILLIIWLLPLTAWSSLGCREQMYGTESILFSSTGHLKRQLPAQFCAGFTISLLSAVGPFIYFVIAGEWASVGAFTAAAVFIPALALCLGTWTGHPKTFEAVYLLLWYIGPLNEIAALDFMGITTEAIEKGMPYWVLTLSLVLTAITWLRRRNRLRNVS